MMILEESMPLSKIDKKLLERVILEVYEGLVENRKAAPKTQVNFRIDTDDWEWFIKFVERGQAGATVEAMIKTLRKFVEANQKSST